MQDSTSIIPLEDIDHSEKSAVILAEQGTLELIETGVSTSLAHILHVVA